MDCIRGHVSDTCTHPPQEIIPALDSLHAQLLTGAGYVPAN